MNSLVAAPKRRIAARKFFALPLVAALLLAFTGLVPANAASYPSGRADVTMSANGNFQFVFDGDSAQVVGQVLPTAPTAKVPTGTVVLLPDAGDTVLGTDVLSNNILPGLFVLIAPPLGLGTHYFRAAYSGDSNFAPKTIRFPVVVHTGPNTQTTLTLSPSGTSTLGQMVSVTAQVSTPMGPLTTAPLGGVTFWIDGVEVATAPVLTGWRANFTTTGMSAGRHVITAEYVHDPWNPSYYSSMSAPVTHTVTSALAAIRTEFHSSHHGDIPWGQAVTVQAVIAPRLAGGATPTGWVQFYDWNTKVGAPVKLVNGKAGFKYTSLKVGKHILNAKYLGSSSYKPGDTPARTVTVLP
ncbi:Ig-like domain-containing protein [Arthrobacter sp. HLT1-20]